jgi:hypothetical protein
MIRLMVETASKRGKVTAENTAEARKLRAIWQRTELDRKSRGVGSQEAFGLKYEIGNQSAVGFFLNGKTSLSLKAAIAFAKGLGCTVADFSPRLAKQLHSEPIPAVVGPSAPAMQLAAQFDARVPQPLREATYAAIINQIDLAVAAARIAKGLPGIASNTQPPAGSKTPLA